MGHECRPRTGKWLEAVTPVRESGKRPYVTANSRQTLLSTIYPVQEQWVDLASANQQAHTQLQRQVQQLRNFFCLLSV